MSKDVLRYDLMVQEALKGVVRKILTEAGRDGLPGEHHFYITFKTQAAGVSIPAHLIAKFPDEMTIVLQNRFWDLKVAADHFSVGLSFNQTPSILTIPYAAITAFVDPSVNFGLQFQVSDDGEAPEPHDEADNDRPEVTSEDGSNVVTVDFGKRK